MNSVNEDLIKVEARLKSEWRRVREAIRNGGLANVWSDEAKADFANIQTEIGKLAFLFRKMHNRYSHDNERYSAEIWHLRSLTHDLRNIKNKDRWVKKLGSDMQDVISDVEGEIRRNGNVFESGDFSTQLRIKLYSKGKLRQLEEWGANLEGYGPHLTLFMLKNWQAVEKIAQSAHPYQNFVFTHLPDFKNLMIRIGLLNIGLDLARVMKSSKREFLKELFEILKIFDRTELSEAVHKYGIYKLGMQLNEMFIAVGFEKYVEYGRSSTLPGSILVHHKLVNRFGLKEIVVIAQGYGPDTGPGAPIDDGLTAALVVLNIEQIIIKHGYTDIFRLQKEIDLKTFCNVLNALNIFENLMDENGIFETAKRLIACGLKIYMELRDPFFHYFLPSCTHLVHTLDDFEKFEPIQRKLSDYPDKYFGYIFMLGLSRYGREKSDFNSFEEIETALNIAIVYWDMLGRSTYTVKIITDGLYNLRPLNSRINRLSFSKTGSILVPLAGKLTGFLVRVTGKVNYKAWKRAYDADIPCEPIIKVYPRSDDKVAVVTKYVGEALGLFLIRNPRFRENVISQRDSIIERLSQLNIIHGHPHDSNFTVLVNEDLPHVWIIDFDQAFIEEE